MFWDWKIETWTEKKKTSAKANIESFGFTLNVSTPFAFKMQEFVLPMNVFLYLIWKFVLAG